MEVGVKSIELSDFDEIAFEIGQLDWICKELRASIPGLRIDSTDTIGHPMKMWEWGRVLKSIKDHFGYPFSVRDPISVLDLGSAVSLIGPALAYLGCNVVETDSDLGWFEHRNKISRYFNAKPVEHAGLFSWMNVGFGGVRQQVPPAIGRSQFDVVMSISTIEHVETSLEQQAWLEMFDMLKPGGLLIVTMDCFPEAKKGYIYDDVRYTNYDMAEVAKRVQELKSYGMQVIGREDYDWHGVHVDDGSFAWISMVKPAILGGESIYEKPSGVHTSEVGTWPEEMGTGVYDYTDEEKVGTEEELPATPAPAVCYHENLDMEGICKSCGTDCRGTSTPTTFPTVPEKEYPPSTKIKTAKKKAPRRKTK